MPTHFLRGVVEDVVGGDGAVVGGRNGFYKGKSGDKFAPKRICLNTEPTPPMLPISSASAAEISLLRLFIHIYVGGVMVIG